MKRYSRLIKKNGFTMLEIITVVIILGVTASLAIVKYGDVLRRVRSQEGRQTLVALFGAQMQYRREVGGGNFYNGNLAGINATLNVAFTQPLRNFKSLTAVNGTVLCGSATVGRIVANDDTYALHVTTEGTIVCTSAANVCGTATCQRIL